MSEVAQQGGVSVRGRGKGLCKDPGLRRLWFLEALKTSHWSCWDSQGKSNSGRRWDWRSGRGQIRRTVLFFLLKGMGLEPSQSPSKKISAAQRTVWRMSELTLRKLLQQSWPYESHSGSRDGEEHVDWRDTGEGEPVSRPWPYLEFLVIRIPNYMTCVSCDH